MSELWGRVNSDMGAFSSEDCPATSKFPESTPGVDITVGSTSSSLHYRSRPQHPCDIDILWSLERRGATNVSETIPLPWKSQTWHGWKRLAIEGLFWSERGRRLGENGTLLERRRMSLARSGILLGSKRDGWLVWRSSRNAECGESTRRTLLCIKKQAPLMRWVRL